MVHRQHAAVRRHTFHMTHRSQAAFSPERRWMIPIIFLRPPNNTTACYIGLFYKILKCSLGIDFLISPPHHHLPLFLPLLPPCSSSTSDWYVTLLQTHSQPGEYHSVIFQLPASSVFPASLRGFVRLGHVWRKKTAQRKREGGRGRDCNSWLWMHTSHFNVSTAAAVNAEKMRQVVVMKRRDGWGGEGCTYKPPTRSSSSVNKCVSGKRGQMPRCNIYMLCWWRESLRWRRMQSFPASCRLWPNFSISTHHPSSMLWSLSPRGSGGRKRCCQHSGEGRASQGPRILLKSPWARQYTLLFPPLTVIRWWEASSKCFRWWNKHPLYTLHENALWGSMRIMGHIPGGWVPCSWAQSSCKAVLTPGCSQWWRWQHKAKKITSAFSLSLPLCSNPTNSSYISQNSLCSEHHQGTGVNLRMNFKACWADARLSSAVNSCDWDKRGGDLSLGRWPIASLQCILG